MKDEEVCQELYKQFWLECLHIICGTVYDQDLEIIVDENGNSLEVVGVSCSEAKKFTATVIDLAAQIVLKTESSTDQTPLKMQSNTKYGAADNN